MIRWPQALTATSALLLLTMLASFTPTPLYPIYRQRWDLDESQVSLIFAGYPIGVMVVLISLGGLSDRLGRVPTLRIGAGLLITAMFVLASAPTFGALVAGRVLQGMATGLITGAGAAALMDLHPKGARAGTSRNTLLLASGIAIGPLLAGQVSSHLPGPTVAPFATVIVLLLLPLVALLGWRVPDRAATRRIHGHTPRSARMIRVPAAIWPAFAMAAVSVASTNVTFASIGSFGPDVVATVGAASPGVAGAYVSGILVIVAMVQVLARRWPVVPCMITGAVATTAGWGLAAVGTSAHQGWLVAATIPLLGIGAGLGLYGSAAHAGAIAPTDRRAEIYSAYLVAAFLALALGALGLGAVLDSHGIVVATAVAAAINAVMSSSLIIAARR